MNQSIILNPSNLKDILRYIHTAVIFHLQSHPDETFTWYDTWIKWNASNLCKCNTTRAVATILYNGYDRKQHNLAFILQTVRNAIPILDEYLGIEDSDDFGGDKMMTPRVVQFQKLMFDFQCIHILDYTKNIVHLFANTIDDHLQSLDQLPEWTATWYNWKGQKIMRVDNLEKLQQVILPESSSQQLTFEDTLRTIIELVPYLDQVFEFHFIGTDVVIIEEVIDINAELENPWQEVGQRNKRTNDAPTPFATPPTSIKNSNPFSALAEENSQNADVMDSSIESKSTKGDTKSSKSQQSNISMALRVSP